jgi:hypothetical protein
MDDCKQRVGEFSNKININMNMNMLVDVFVWLVDIWIWKFKTFEKIYTHICHVKKETNEINEKEWWMMNMKN